MNQTATTNVSELTRPAAPAGFQYGKTSQWLSAKSEAELSATIYKALNGVKAGLKGACYTLSRPKVKAKDRPVLIATALAYRSVLYTAGMPLTLIHTLMNEDLTLEEVERLPVEIY